MTNGGNTRKFFKEIVLFSGVSAIALGAVAAHAQQAAPAASEVMGLEEITVTAQRREENLREVPISVSVFSAEQIQRSNIQGVAEYFSQTPNVSFTSSGSRDRKDISIRGVSNLLSSDDNLRANTFGFYIDEFNVATGTVNPNIVDVDRIEILRGPQGTYFGRNATGGAVNITTKMPTNEFSAETSLGYSSFDTYDASAIVNAPVVADKLAVRLVGRYQKSDGNIKNINPIGGGNDSEYKYGKGIIRFTPNENLTIDLTGAYTNEVVGMREGVPSGVMGSFSSSLFGPVADPDGVGFWPNNDNKVNFDRKQRVGSEFYYFTGRIKYEAEKFNITSITGYINSKGFLQGDIDSTSKDYFYETKPIKRTSLSEELRVSSNPGGKLDWTVGVMAARDRGNTDQHTFAGADNPFSLPDGFEVTSTFSAGESKSYAVFGEGVYHVTDALSITLGARYTHEKQDLFTYNTSGGAINGLLDGSKSFNDFSPKLSIGYAIDDTSNVYATVSKGFKAGGIQLSRTFGATSYKPENLWNYEVGYKSELFDRRLRLNLAAFYMDWKNLQTDFAVENVNNGVITFVSGIENTDARSYGAEFEATGLILPGWTVSAGAGYLNAKFKNYEDAYIDGAVYDLGKAQMPNSPKWTLSANTEYNFAAFADYDAFVRAEWFYRSEILGSKSALIYNGFPYHVPSYNVTNLRAGIQNEVFGVTAYVENLFNEKYYTSYYDKAFAGGLYVEPSKQVFGVKLTMKIN